MKRNCRFCNSVHVKKILSFKNYPIFIGCSDQPPENDELFNFEIFYCEECQVFQQIDLPSPKVLYKENRAFGIGKTWSEHYEQFFRFMMEKTDLTGDRNVLEVGGGNGVMLSKFLGISHLKLYDIEPSPQYTFPEVTTIREFFPPRNEIGVSMDLMFASHFIEHCPDVGEFFARAAKTLKPTGSLFIACPNIEKSFEHLHLNAFTADHFNYFSPDTLCKVAEKYGFFCQDYFQFRDHGMYVHFAKTPTGFSLSNPSELLESFHRFEKKIREFALRVEQERASEVFLFGASAFSITFLRYLKGELRVLNVLDNEPTKKDRRLCGTNLICKNPDIIRELASPKVLVYMGAYSREVCEQLRRINPGVQLFCLEPESRAVSQCN